MVFQDAPMPKMTFRQPENQKEQNHYGKIRVQVYRYNPDKDAKPYMQDYELEILPTDVKLLDALVKLKAQDDTLSFRRSCREGICGSDGMNINGKTAWRV